MNKTRTFKIVSSSQLIDEATKGALLKCVTTRFCRLAKRIEKRETLWQEMHRLNGEAIEDSAYKRIDEIEKLLGIRA